jgi:hypothetical protein
MHSRPVGFQQGIALHNTQLGTCSAKQQQQTPPVGSKDES